METQQINKILWNCADTKNFYIGCYPCDVMPRIVKFPSTVVLNIEPLGFRGVHWVGIFIDKPNHIYYFDSLGKPPNKCIVNNLKVNDIKYITRNFKRYQSDFSNFCGVYCLAFIHYMSINCHNNKAFYDFLKYYKSDYTYNDQFVYNYVKNSIK